MSKKINALIYDKTYAGIQIKWNSDEIERYSLDEISSGPVTTTAIGIDDIGIRHRYEYNPVASRRGNTISLKYKKGQAKIPDGWIGKWIPEDAGTTTITLENGVPVDVNWSGSKLKQGKDWVFLQTDELQKYYEELNEKIEKSKQDPDARAKRLKKAQKQPTYKIIKTKVFNRNPDVIAEVLERANGKCESEVCKNTLFRRNTDNTWYLEVHHRKPLSDGGADTVDNAIALCPICHRKEHFGERKFY